MAVNRSKVELGVPTYTHYNLLGHIDTPKPSYQVMFLLSYLIKLQYEVVSFEALKFMRSFPILDQSNSKVIREWENLLIK
jgi:hypothetical protein